MISDRDVQRIAYNTILNNTAVRLTGTAVWNPGNVLAAASTTTTLTVTSAALGDTVLLSFTLDLQGQILSGYVSATNTVTAVLFNPTAGALDLASGTLRAEVWKSTT